MSAPDQFNRVGRLRRLMSVKLCHNLLAENGLQRGRVLEDAAVTECRKVWYRHFTENLSSGRKQRCKCRANPRMETMEDFTDGRWKDDPRHTPILY
jgi:hypothetical protein